MYFILRTLDLVSTDIVTIEMLTLSTRNAEMPFGPAAPVRAMTKYTSEAPPPLMKALLPCKDMLILLAALHSRA